MKLFLKILLIVFMTPLLILVGIASIFLLPFLNLWIDLFEKEDYYDRY